MFCSIICITDVVHVHHIVNRIQFQHVTDGFEKFPFGVKKEKKKCISNSNAVCFCSLMTCHRSVEGKLPEADQSKQRRHGEGDLI